MSGQWWVVIPLVTLATVYAAWRLAPARWQSAIRRRLGLPPPTPPAGSCADCAQTHPPGRRDR